PFPIAKGDDGKWGFDTYAGFEEIIDRRVGENELQTIDTMRAYFDAQKEYSSADHDDDGVLEYAQIRRPVETVSFAVAADQFLG
ncbi:DUF2950 family protein, partial [Rhizobium ruizarguesonis]